MVTMARRQQRMVGIAERTAVGGREGIETSIGRMLRMAQQRAEYGRDATEDIS